MKIKDYKTEQVSPRTLAIGDTIVLNGQMITVGKGTVKSGFMGVLVDGWQMQNVTRVLFPKWHRGCLVGWVAQR